jgi:peroxiredoxin
MAQLCHDYLEFKRLNTEILMVVPNGPKMIEQYFQENHPPYSILTDKGARVGRQFGIATRHVHFLKVALFKPSVFLINQTGDIVYTNYLTSYIKEPDNREPLAVLRRIASG